MRYIILLLLAATVGLGVLSSQQAATIKEQQGQLAAATDRRKAESLAQQVQCAKQAKAVYSDLGYKPQDRASYQNHFSSRLNKCLIYVESRTSDDHAVWDVRNIYDAIENKELGTFMWRSLHATLPSIPPTICQVISEKGVAQHCNSGDEFEEMAKLYMEG